MATPIQVNIRATPSEKAAWIRAATAEGRTLANWIRRVLGEAAKRGRKGDRCD